jgi:hypothetical protein
MMVWILILCFFVATSHQMKISPQSCIPRTDLNFNIITLDCIFNPEQHYIFEPTDEISDVTQIKFNTFSTDSILVVRNVGQLKKITVKYGDLTLCESFVLPPAIDVVIADHVCVSSSLLFFLKMFINSIIWSRHCLDASTAFLSDQGVYI